MYGSRAYAHEERSFTGRETPGPDGWIVPAGEVYGYSIGYHGTGKRGARLSTQKGFGQTFEQALAMAQAALTPSQRAQFDRAMGRR